MLRSVSVLLAVVLGCAAPTVGVQKEAEAPCIVPADQRDGAMGLYQASSMAPGTWHHVGTIHGWVDDYAVCQEIVAFLNGDEPGGYICRTQGS